jgi:D-glycero-D-manno-heptose 1,7-bisphosphate phosphatase
MSPRLDEMPFLDKQRWYEIYDERSHSCTRTPAIFLDRDGVIILEKHYLQDPEQVELYPGIVKKLESLREFKVPIVVVTNQSGIGQGFFGWDEYNLVHQRMLDLLGVEQPFTAVYANAHHPAETKASWRKPNPGMFLQAAADMNICLESSVMVGDKWVDIEAATRAGIKQLVHVKTGHGADERHKIIRNFQQVELIDSLGQMDIELLRRQFTSIDGSYFGAQI